MLDLLQAGPLIPAPSRKKVIYSGTVAVVHSGAGEITTAVDISSLGITDITKVREVWLGATMTDGSINQPSLSRIAITSTSNMNVITKAFGATTVTVAFAIYEAEGLVQRGTVVVTVNSTAVSGTSTLSTAVDTGKAKAYRTGISGSAAYNHVSGRIILTNTTTVTGVGEASMNGNATLGYVVDGG